MSNTNIILTKFLSKYTNIDFFKDIVNICLYPSEFSISIGSNEFDSIPNHLNNFFNDLSKKLGQYGSDGKQTADKFIEVSKTFLKFRSAGKGLITYDTIDQHYVSTNALVKKLIQEVKADQIKSDDQFRQKIDSVLLSIRYYNDFQRALDGLTKIHEFTNMMEKSEVSPIECVEKYKEMTLQLDSDLSNLSTNVSDELSTDYYILSDKESASQISGLITDYLCTNYSFYNTGLEAYDRSVDGFESSSVHIVASPSNGGKSITLANLLYRIAKHNNEDFKSSDAALYITCEDDYVKTTRKFMSIFGNYSYDSIRDIYRTAHGIITNIKKTKPEVDDVSKGHIKGIFDEILYDSILKTTSGMLKVIFKYSPENTLSAGDIQRYIKKLQMQGINIKYIIIDYLDVMRPTIMNGFYEEHHMLGVITQDLRTLSRIFGIPVITATQTSKLGDDVGRTMSNGLVGESWKKVKFSDYIYMQRVRDDLNIFSPDVSKYVFEPGTEWAEDSSRVISMKDDLIQYLKPMEMQVTKSKERGKGFYRFVLFCTRNLRLYNNVNEFLLDMPELNSNSSLVSKKIKRLQEIGDMCCEFRDPIESSTSLTEFDNSEWIEDAIGF